jgi:hypothetical protein
MKVRRTSDGNLSVTLIDYSFPGNSIAWPVFVMRSLVNPVGLGPGSVRTLAQVGKYAMPAQVSPRIDDSRSLILVSRYLLGACSVAFAFLSILAGTELSRHLFPTPCCQRRSVIRRPVKGSSRSA